MPGEVAPLYLQLLGPGLAWTLAHCGGMCGPIVVALRVGEGGPAAGARRLACYQAGRAATLGAAGALCGGLGYAVSDRIELWSPWLILGLAAVMLAGAAHRLGWLRWPRAGGDGALAARLARPLAVFAARHPHLGLLAIGGALGALPCGVVFWALGLAATSGSPLHGALLLALLVGLSSLPLAIAALAGASATGRLRARFAWVPTAALLLSAALLAAHGAASLRWIPHLHAWKIMLW